MVSAEKEHYKIVQSAFIQGMNSFGAKRPCFSLPHLIQLSKQAGMPGHCCISFQGATMDVIGCKLLVPSTWCT
jgi:hypothetical protein